MIYFMQPTAGGPVKIGFSDDVDRRRMQLEGVYGQPLAVLATMEGGREEEASIHYRFRRLRLGRTEQFRPGPDLMAFIGRPLLVDPNPDAVEVMSVSMLSAKLHIDVIESARIVAAYRNESITDLLSEILRPALATMEQEEIAKRGKAVKGKGSPK